MHQGHVKLWGWCVVMCRVVKRGVMCSYKHTTLNDLVRYKWLVFLETISIIKQVASFTLVSMAVRWGEVKWGEVRSGDVRWGNLSDERQHSSPSACSGCSPGAMHVVRHHLMRWDNSQWVSEWANKIIGDTCWHRCAMDIVHYHLMRGRCDEQLIITSGDQLISIWSINYN